MIKNPRMHLRAWMERQGLKHADVAQALGISQSQVSHLLRGARRPSLDLALRIYDLTGIPIAAWTHATNTRRAAPSKAIA